MKTMSMLYLFGTVNINKVVTPDTNCPFAVYFKTQASFLRVCNVNKRVCGIYCPGLPNIPQFKR